MRVALLLLVIGLMGACVLAYRVPLDLPPLCSPDHPEYLDPRCRKLAGSTK